MKPILITSYVHPDLDGTACAVAYAEFLNDTGHKAVAGMIGNLHDEAQYIFERFGFEGPLLIEDSSEYDEVILVDASEISGLEGRVDPEKVIEIIDHRKVNDSTCFPNAKIQIELVGAAATLISEKYIQNKLQISECSATLLYGGIVSNTLNFKGGVTTDRDRAAAKWLQEKASLPNNFWKDLFRAKSNVSSEKLAVYMHQGYASFEFEERRIGIAQIEMIGARDMIQARKADIITILKDIMKDEDLNYIFANIIDLEECKNYFLTHDYVTKELLKNILNVSFSEDIAERSELIMRKQIVPLLRMELEKEVRKS